MNKKKNIIVFIVIFFFLLILIWYSRFLSINKKYDDSHVDIYLGETEIFDGVEITPVEADLLSNEELLTKFKLYELKDTNKKYICLKIKVKSNHNKIDYEKFIANGFRTDVWFNGIDPILFYTINNGNMQEINDNGEGCLWIVGDIDINYNKYYKENLSLKETDFRYVFFIDEKIVEFLCRYRG